MSYFLWILRLIWDFKIVCCSLLGFELYKKENILPCGDVRAIFMSSVINIEMKPLSAPAFWLLSSCTKWRLSFRITAIKRHVISFCVRGHFARLMKGVRLMIHSFFIMLWAMLSPHANAIAHGDEENDCHGGEKGNGKILTINPEGWDEEDSERVDASQMVYGLIFLRNPILHSQNRKGGGLCGEIKALAARIKSPRASFLTSSNSFQVSSFALIEAITDKGIMLWKHVFLTLSLEAQSSGLNPFT